jgi:16S rRNA (adenine1518-N6/adenine1519-N6)-dimethyltransferase
VHFEQRAEPLAPADAAVLSRIVAMAFNQRRKMLRAALRGLGPESAAALEDAGISPTARAEEIPVEGFCALARAVQARGL